MIGPVLSDSDSGTSRARALAPLYVVVFVGFLGYSLMITVFTPMILVNDNGMLPASSSAASRSIVLGLLLCLYPLGQFVGAPVLGAASDRVGRRPVLLGSLASSTVWYGMIGAIVSNIWADVLEKAGYKVTVEPSLGTRAIVVPAIEKGQIDLEPDYAASLLGFLHGGNPQPAGDNITTAIPADQKALASYGVTVLPASKALDTNVFAVTKATATKDHLTTISSLKPYASKLTLGGPPECPTFAGCEPGLKKVYGLTFAGFKSPATRRARSAWRPSRTARCRWLSSSPATATWFRTTSWR